MRGRLRVRVLGPVEVDVDGVPLAGLGPPKQRALLAALALSPGRLVPAEDLVAALWEEPPESAGAVVQTYVSALRRLLEPDRRDQRWQVLLTRRPGYVLACEDDDVDALRFAGAVSAARAMRATGQLVDARTALVSALALWRGPALADVADTPVGQRVATAMNALRLDALEERVDLDLALGAGDALVPELERLVAAEPLRERLRGQLLVALYRAGRQADALRAYEDARRLLADELGVDPSARLQETFQAVLRQDPALDPVPPEPVEPVVRQEPTAGGDPEPAPVSATAHAPAAARPARRRLPALLAAGLTLLLLASFALVRLGGTAEATVLRPGAVGLVDLESGRVAEQVDLGERPSALVVHDGVLWAPLPRRGVLASTEAEAPRRVREATLDPGLGGAAAADDAIWVSQPDSRELIRVDVRSRRVAQRVPVGGRPDAVVATRDAVWVANRLDDTVTRVSARSGRVLRTVAVGHDPVGVAAGKDALWVVGAGDASLTRVGLPSGSTVQRYRLTGTPSGVLLAHDAVWVADAAAGTVTRVDPTTGRVLAAVPVGLGASGLAATADAVVVSSAYDGWLVVLDPTDGTVSRRLHLGSAPLAVHSDGRRVWAGSSVVPDAGRRGGTLRVALGGPRESPDPAVSFGGTLVTSLTHDGLVAVRRAAGADGSQLVPDLATDLPLPADGGRTWTFRLRSGIAWSTGGTVRVRDVRPSFERLVRDGFPLLGAIRGTERCSPARCDLSAGITADEAQGTVSFHLREPDPDFLALLAMPQAAVLPAGSPAPVTPERAHTVDWSVFGATGPYRVHSVSPQGRVVLVRNERFTEWSRDAAPDGLADRIEVGYEEDAGPATDAVLAGDLDLLLDPPPERVAELASRFPTQLRKVDEPGMLRLVLDTRRPPFDQVEARRAVSRALDRAALARDVGGGQLGVPSCQTLPRVVPGYTPYCPAGEAPDVQGAREAVLRSGTAGALVRLAVPPYREALGRALEKTLDSIGYDARLSMPARDYFRGVAERTPEAHVASWYAEAPSAVSFMVLVRCATHVDGGDQNTNLNVSGYCDPTAERLIEEALAAQQRDPSHASAAWRRVDRQLTDTVAWVPLASTQRAVLVRAGVGGLVHVPVIGPALELLSPGARPRA
ncbi:MAG TPA: BTAD domain-containing putative transcriptional regulator [Mycobacteriales bacterium]|nr:BTAD domain-containing putative transcriptional regulator [Mycobacteriales bacterium]